MDKFKNLMNFVYGMEMSLVLTPYVSLIKISILL